MVSLREIMTEELVTVSPDLSLQELAQILAGHGISGVPVVSGRTLVGVISTTDLVDFESSTPGSPRQRDGHTDWGEIETRGALAESDDGGPGVYFTEYWEDAGADVLERFRSDSPEWNRMAESAVGNVMTDSVVSLPPEADVQEAARIMVASGVHRILVVEESGNLVGIVTSSDIVRAVAERGLSDG